MLLLSVCVVSVLCSIFVFAANFGYFQNRWPTLAERSMASDMAHSLGIAVMSLPIPVLSVALAYYTYDGFKYGLKFPYINKTFFLTGAAR